MSVCAVLEIPSLLCYNYKCPLFIKGSNTQHNIDSPQRALISWVLLLLDQNDNAIMAICFL